jgi:LuxR family quorum sensing-dependent transcriptional regulator
MSRKAFERTIEVIRSLERARTPVEVCGMLLSSLRQFGAEHVLAGIIPGPGTSRQQQLSSIVLDHWPTEWVRRYFSHGYLFRDPAIRTVQTSSSSFLWSELEPSYRSDTMARRVMEEAGDFRLRQATDRMLSLSGRVLI